MYEALRAYFMEDLSSAEVAKAFGYTPGSFRVLCHQFRRDDEPTFFLSNLTCLSVTNRPPREGDVHLKPSGRRRPAKVIVANRQK